jgi:acetylornithine/N-succinyldiaminopimelate aminotransferase
MREPEFAFGSLMEITERPEIVFVQGEGSWLTDHRGKRYLDFVQGWAVNCLGHCPRVVAEALAAQARLLITPSPAFYNEPALRLASLITEHSAFQRVFFTNSGAEANEGAIKLARKWGRRFKGGASEIITFDHGFHGRTLATMSASGKPGWDTMFAPQVAGFPKATLNDIGSVEERITDRTVAVMLEPVQGEGGVRPLEGSTLEEARALADAFGAMLVFDEVQTGVGRTGEFFAWQRSGVRPDAVTLAKGLANGLPIGALLVGDGAPTGFVPGDHASTFGGNPVACAAACAVVDAIDDDLLAHVRGLGSLFAESLPEVRGAGLLLAVELHRPAGPVAHAALEKGLLVGTAGDTALRITPPLTITREEAQHGIELIREVTRA